MGVSGVSLDAASVATALPQERRALLKQAVREVVGGAFLAPMLRMARQSHLKGRYGHGGRGEEVFGAQLDLELARRASHRLNSDLADAMVRRFDGKA